MSGSKYTEGTIDSSGIVPVLRWLRKRWVPLKDYNSLADHANERERQVDACRRDYRVLEEAVQALVESLPKCRECDRVATKASQVEMSGPRHTICDEHRGDWGHRGDDMRYAAPLRALLALLEGR